jgi:hypothetical protein
MKDDAVLLVQCAHKIAHFRTKHALHRALLGGHDVDFQFSSAQRGRYLKPDETRTDHDDPPRTFHRVDDGAAIAERAQRMDMRLVGAWHRQAYRLRAGRQQEPVIGHNAAAGEHDVARLGIDRDDIALEPQVDMSFRVKTVRPQRQPIFRRAAGEVIFRQVRPIHRRRSIVAQHDNAAGKFLPPQHLGRGKTRRAAADDHDSTGHISGRLAARFGLFALVPDDNSVALMLDLPDRQPAKRRGARGFSAAQIEAGVVPGTADAVADHEAIRERPVIMAAICVDGENLPSGAHQQDILVADMPEQRLAGEFA